MTTNTTTTSKTTGKGTSKGKTGHDTTSKPEAPDTTPTTREQLGYKGEVELVDGKLHSHRVECACGNVRWVAPGDLFQVHECKPCVARRRKDKRNEKAKDKRAVKSIAKLEEKLAAAKAKAGVGAA